MQFFRLQGNRCTDKEYWAYDTTSISGYSEQLAQILQGKNKDHDKLPQLNLALLYGEDSGLPFYCKKLSGNISDVMTIKQLLKDMDFLDYKRIKLVLDRDFYSERNISELYSERLKFLMGAKLSLKYIRKELEEHRDTVHNWSNFHPETEVFGLTVPIQWKYKRTRPYKNDEVIERRRMYLHLYYDSVRALEDERSFAKLMCQLHEELLSGNRQQSHESDYEQYFDIKTTPVRGIKIIVKEETVSAVRKIFGYFALIGNEAHSPLLKITMHELPDELEMIEHFKRNGRKPQIGEVTKKQLDIFTALNIDSPKSSLC